MKSELNSRMLYPVIIKNTKGVKWGYIDDLGFLKIKPKYDGAGNFNENGLAVVRKNNFYGIIDNSGRYVLEPKYDDITEFFENRAVLINKYGFFVIDNDGKIITKEPYSYIGRYYCGRALFLKTLDDKTMYGYLSLKGEEVIKAKYKEASNYNDRKAIVKVDESYYKLIDISGNTINTYNFPRVDYIGDGFLAFKDKADGSFGFIDEAGRIVIPPIYYTVTSFKYNRSIVSIIEGNDEKFGLIDKKGKFAIKPKYNNIYFLGEDRVAVGIPINKDKPYIGSIYAICDLKGRFVTEFLYYEVYNYNHGVASVSNENKTFFIDVNGNLINKLPILSGNGMLSIVGRLIKAYVDYKIKYFNIYGEVIWKESRYISLDKGYLVENIKNKSNRNYLVYYPQILGIKSEKISNYINNNLKELSKVKYLNNNIELDYQYIGNFQVEFFKNKLLVLELSAYKYYFGSAHGMENRIYVHVDLSSGKFYRLKDLFRKNINYVNIISSIIKKQIEEEKKYSFIWKEQYNGIKENQPFYIDDKNLYIFFYPYTIGPYSEGFPTFKIPFNEILNLIDIYGEFWSSFN